MRTYAAALALLGLLATAPPASAATTGTTGATADATWAGDCGYTLVAEPTGTTGGGFAAVFAAAFAVFSPSSPATPVAATVTCTLHHAPWAGPYSRYDVTFDGTTVVAGTGSVRLPADVAPDELYECLTVDYADDTPTHEECWYYTSAQVPPQVVQDAADSALAAVPGSKDALCAALAGASPLAAGGALVTSDGDVYAGRNRVWDC